MSTKKLDPAAVQQLVRNAGKDLLENKVLAELIGRIRDLLPDEEQPEDKPPQKKKQFVVLLSDPLRKIEAGAELAGWVLQLPEDASPLSLHERIQKAAYDFNASRRGRKLPVQTVGETFESVPAKALKEVELWCKTREPVLVLTTNNELPNTPCLFDDGNRGAKVDRVVINVDTNALQARIDDIIEWARTAERISCSAVQRHFRVSYTSALHMLEALVGCGHIRETESGRYEFVAGNNGEAA